MKKTIVLILGLLWGAVQISSAQVEFMHSIGASLYSGGDAGGVGITYSPRLNIAKVGDNGAISLGTHLSLGGSISSREGGSITFDLPLLAEINLGNAATKESDAGFGFFGGVGYGLSTLSSDVAIVSTSGPVIDAGIRFVLAEKLPLSLRASYLISTNTAASSVLGLGISYNIGVLH